MTPTGQLDKTTPPRASARRTIFRVLLFQSIATAVLLLGVLTAFAGVGQRPLIFLGVLAVVGVAAWLSAWLGHKLVSPLERLVTLAEQLAAGHKPSAGAVAEQNSAWLEFGETSRLSRALDTLRGLRESGAAISTGDPIAAAGVKATPAGTSPADRLEALLGNLPWAIWITDGEGRILHHNALAVELFESEGSELKGQSVEGLWKRWAGSEAWSEVHHTLKSGARWDGEFELATRDHRTPQFEITAVPMETTADLQTMLFLAEDVTELRQLGAALIDLERQSTRGQMAGEVAHEINNFLTILGGNLDIIPMLLAKGEHDKVQTKFVAMRGALDKIAGFSEGLMGPRDPMEPGPCDLNRQIENLLAYLKPQNRFDGVDLIYRSNPDLPPFTVRASQIQQVLTNLLNNAADAIHLGGRREGQIEVTAQELPGGAGFALTVSDNGPGLSKSASARIFRERFTDKKSGHGLGLLNCHAIARSLGGTLTAESAEGRGTAFTLTVPCLTHTKEAPTSTPALTSG